MRGTTPGDAPPHMVHVFPSFAAGGVPLRTAEIINALGGAYRHTVIALDGRFEAQTRVAPDVKVEYLQPATGKAGPPRRLAAIAAELRRLGPDLLVSYNWGAIEWAAVNRFWHRVPHLHLEDGFGPGEATRQLSRRVRARRVALKRAAVIVPSENLRRIATEIWRLDPRTVRLVPNGVDCDLFACPPDPALVPGIASAAAAGAVVVGTVAPLRPEKDLAHLIRSFARVAPGRNVVLAIVGGGAERERLAALVAELGIGERTLMPGHVDTPARVYGLLDVFAMSSVTEQMPISLIQAMAAGRPVVATDVGDIRNMVAEPNRPFVVPPRDDDAYDAALARLIEDSALRRSLGAANRARAVEAYPLQKMFDAWRSIFAQAIGRGAAARA